MGRLAPTLTPLAPLALLTTLARLPLPPLEAPETLAPLETLAILQRRCAPVPPSWRLAACEP
jgi:hypothetical protein